MKLVINGEEKQFDDVRTVADLVRSLGMDKQPVAVEVNRNVVPKRLHEQTALKEGDIVEVVTLVGGG